MRHLKDGRVLQGVIPLLFTPFTADGKSFDRGSMRRQIECVVDAGVSAVVACGKAGEFEGMQPPEIEQVLKSVLELVAGRVPVGMGIISVEEDEALQAARMAVSCGADFAMVKKRFHEDVHQFFLNVAKEIPVMLYDQTNQGNLDISSHVSPLLRQCDRIVGVKVSGNVYSFGQLKEQFPDVPLLCGWDNYSLMGYLSGSDGVIAGSAAFMPEREVALHRLAGEKRWEEARELFYQRMLPFIVFATPDPYAFSVSKYMLHWRKLIDSPVVRPPYENTPEWVQQELYHLAQMLELV